MGLEVWVDDERLCLAGMEDWALVDAHVIANRYRHPAAPKGDDIVVDIGGLSEPDSAGVSHHARWNGRKLAVGMTVTIKIVETDRPDGPIKRYRADKEVRDEPFTDEEIEEFERSAWLRLKAKFEPDAGGS